jgi:hypothetical protein
MSTGSTIIATGEKVRINWIGFDLIWIIHENGDPELVHPSVLGMRPRKRPNYKGSSW